METEELHALQISFGAANAPVSYLEVPGFKSRPRRPAMLMDVFCEFPQSRKAIAGIIP
jgi:hypothetical protein